MVVECASEGGLSISLSEYKTIAGLLKKKKDQKARGDFHAGKFSRVYERLSKDLQAREYSAAEQAFNRAGIVIFTPQESYVTGISHAVFNVKLALLQYDESGSFNVNLYNILHGQVSALCQASNKQNKADDVLRVCLGNRALRKLNEALDSTKPSRSVSRASGKAAILDTLKHIPIPYLKPPESGQFGEFLANLNLLREYIAKVYGNVPPISYMTMCPKEWGIRVSRLGLPSDTLLIYIPSWDKEATIRGPGWWKCPKFNNKFLTSTANAPAIVVRDMKRAARMINPKLPSFE